MKKIWAAQLVPMIYGLLGEVNFQVLHFDGSLVVATSLSLITFIFCLIITIKYCKKSLFRLWSLLLIPFFYTFYFIIFFFISGLIYPTDSEDYGAGLLGLFVFIVMLILVVINTIIGVLIWRVNKNQDENCL